MSKMALLKYISSIYADKLKNLQQNSNPLYIIAYEVFLQKYGLKSVSENKYNQVLRKNINNIFYFFSIAFGNGSKLYKYSENIKFL